VGYSGFAFRELAERMKPLVEKYGVQKVSRAIADVCVHEHWRTQLSKEARRACLSALGPPLVVLHISELVLAN
jgi:hypothetical protein